MSTMPIRRKGQGGFTLIELLVVVLIIGILASIAIPAFLGQKKKAQDMAAKSIVRSGVIAAETYYTEHESFAGMPPTLLGSEEQNVVWKATDADATKNEVQVIATGVLAKEDGYILASTSKTGVSFIYIRTSSGAALRCSGSGSVSAWVTPATPPTSCGGAFSDGW